MSPRAESIMLDASSVIAPGLDGFFGVLPNHAPLLAGLGRGQIKINKTDKKEFLQSVDGGFLEVKHNHVIILVG